MTNGDLWPSESCARRTSFEHCQRKTSNTLILFENAKIEFKKEQIPIRKGNNFQTTIDNAKLSYDQAEQNLKNARSDLQIIKLGSAGGSTIANTISELQLQEPS